jgi:hypothetical protein
MGAGSCGDNACDEACYDGGEAYEFVPHHDVDGASERWQAYEQEEDINWAWVV